MRVSTWRADLWLIGTQVAAAFFLVTCAGLTVGDDAGRWLDDISPDSDGGLVLVSLASLVALTLPVLVLLALLFSAAMLQLSLGLTNTELRFRRSLHAVLVGSLPLAARSVVLGLAIVTLGPETAVRAIQFGDPFIVAAMGLLYAYLRSVEKTDRRSAVFACFFTFGLPLLLQVVVGRV